MTMLDESRSHPDEQRWLTHHRYLYLLAKLAVIGIVAAVAWRVLSILSTVLMPAVVAFVLAYIFDPLIDVFERRRVPRTLAIAGFALVLLVLFGVLVVVVLPAFFEQLFITVQKLPEWLEGVYRQVAALAEQKLGYTPTELDETVRKALVSVQSGVLRVVTGVTSSVSAVVNALLVPLFFFYFLRDFDRLKVKPLALVPPRWRDLVVSRATAMDRAVGGWLRGQVQVAMVLATLYAIGLTIVGIRLGYVIGIVAGLLNFIPYFGTVTGIALSVLMILIGHEGLRPIIGVAVVFGSVLTLDAIFITPRLVGSKVGMHPLLVIVVVLAGGALFGLVGMLLAVPVTAAAGVLLQDALELYHRSDFWNGPRPPAPVTRLGGGEAAEPARRERDAG